ncbi:hypothetical protein C8R46DRAFT_1262949 [Mycena filopes]|nr:hypothetical protein C8R46DRAFT_1262949 [Mycena filopes]
MMQFPVFALIVLALGAPVHSGVVAHGEDEISDVIPAEWLNSEEEISHNNGSLSLAPRVGAEVVTCYNSGVMADRAPLISAIDDWCGKVIGTTVTNGQTISASYNFFGFTVFVSAEAINGYVQTSEFSPAVDVKGAARSCNFVIDGNCNRLLRLPVDKCNTGGENGKQGGYETDSCGQWRTDPN